MNLHEIFPVEDYVYSGYDFWYAKLNLGKEKLADLSILPVYYKDLAEDQFNLITCVSRVKKKFHFANVRSNFILTTCLGHSSLLSACWSLESLLLRLTLHRPHIDPTSTPHRPYIGLTSTLHRPHIISHRPLPPHHFYCFPSTTTTTFLLFFPHNQHISIVFPPPPPPPHFYCFPSTTTTTTTFLLFSLHHHHYHISIVPFNTATTTTFLLFSPHNHHISIVFPPPPHFYCFPSNTTTTTTFPLFSSTTTTTFLRNREHIPVEDSQTHSPNCPMVKKLPRECPNRK